MFLLVSKMEIPEGSPVFPESHHTIEKNRIHRPMDRSLYSTDSKVHIKTVKRTGAKDRQKEYK